MTERFTVDYDITTGNYDIHDKKVGNGVEGYIAYLSDEEQANLICDLLNEQEELIKRLKQIREEQIETILKQKRKIKELETRNKRQYNRLKKITDLMTKRDWKTLNNMVNDWEKQEKQLQAEWGTYCGDKE